MFQASKYSVPTINNTLHDFAISIFPQGGVIANGNFITAVSRYLTPVVMMTFKKKKGSLTIATLKQVFKWLTGTGNRSFFKTR